MNVHLSFEGHFIVDSVAWTPRRKSEAGGERSDFVRLQIGDFHRNEISAMKKKKILAISEEDKNNHDGRQYNNNNNNSDWITMNESLIDG